MPTNIYNVNAAVKSKMQCEMLFGLQELVRCLTLRHLLNHTTSNTGTCIASRLCFIIVHASMDYD